MMCHAVWSGSGAKLASDVEVNTLNSEDIYDWNTFDKPDTISIKTQQVPSQARWAGLQLSSTLGHPADIPGEVTGLLFSAD